MMRRISMTVLMMNPRTLIGVDVMTADQLRPHALAIPYRFHFRKAFVPRARTGRLSDMALREAIQESLQKSFQAHRVAMTFARVSTGRAEAGTSCQAEVGTTRQALPSSHPDYNMSAPRRHRLKRDRVSAHSDK